MSPIAVPVRRLSPCRGRPFRGFAIAPVCPAVSRNQIRCPFAAAGGE